LAFSHSQGHSRSGQAANRPGHVRYAAEAEVSKPSPGERSGTGPCRGRPAYRGACLRARIRATGWLMRAATSLAFCFCGHAYAFARWATADKSLCPPCQPRCANCFASRASAISIC